MTDNNVPYRSLRPEAEVSAEFVGRCFVIRSAAPKYAGLACQGLRAIEHPAGFVMVEMGLEDGRVHWFGTSLFDPAPQAPTWTAEHRAQWAEAKRELAASGNDLAPWMHDWRAKHIEGQKAYGARRAKSAAAEREAKARERAEVEQLLQMMNYRATVHGELKRLIKH